MPASEPRAIDRLVTKTPGMELLPAELMAKIARHLETCDLARLMQASTTMRERIEPVLYDRKEARHLAMRFACSHGELSLLRLAVAYGASVSVVDIDLTVPMGSKPCRNRESPGTPSSVKTSTLHLAVKNHQVDAFKLLLELGARVDSANIDRPQRRALVRRLCRRTSTDLLQLFLEAGYGAQLASSDINRALINLVGCGASSHIILLLLDGGANPNSWKPERPAGPLTFISPLSSAILGETSPELFQLLISKGSKIEGADIPEPTQKPLHIPIYAAVSRMLQWGIAKVQMCLDNGALINQPALAIRGKHVVRLYYITSPLMFYLESIDSWHPSETGLARLEGLQYLIDKGASACIPAYDQPPNPFLRSWLLADPPSSIDLLLDKWGVAKLAVSEFSSFIRLLTQHGGAGRHTSRLLSRYDYTPQWAQGRGRYPTDEDREALHKDPVVSAWLGFVELLLDAPDRKESATGLLHQYILDKGETNESHGYLTAVTIDRLLAAGAQINEYKVTEVETLTPLHELCWYWHIFECTYEDQTSHFDVHYRGGAAQRRDFITLLLSRGADPTIKTGDGMTAADILLQMKECYSEEGSEFMESIVSRLRESSLETPSRGAK